MRGLLQWLDDRWTWKQNGVKCSNESYIPASCKLPASTLAGWKEAFLRAGQVGLKSRQADVRDEENALTGHSEEIITQRFYQVTSAKVAKKAQARLSNRILLKGGEEPHLPMKEMKGAEAVEHPAHGSALNGHRPQRASRYPDKETLQRMVNEMPVTAIAKKLGVSDTAVARECKKHGIVKPGRGDWAKAKATKKEGRKPGRSGRMIQIDKRGKRCAAFLEIRREGQ